MPPTQRVEVNLPWSCLARRGCAARFLNSAQLQVLEYIIGRNHGTVTRIPVVLLFHMREERARCLLAQIWWRLRGWLQGISEVAQTAPHFFSPSEFLQRTIFSSSADNILTCEREKMTQSFSHNTHSFNTSYYVSVSNNLTVTEDRSNILAWLSPLDPKLRHQDIQGRRVEDIGGWLLETEEFRSWNAGGEGDESDKAVLFCYGDPGVGKTYIR